MLWAISFWFRHWKNFKDRPTFAKVTVKIKVAQFFWLTVHYNMENTRHTGDVNTSDNNTYQQLQLPRLLDPSTLYSHLTPNASRWETKLRYCRETERRFNIHASVNAFCTHQYVYDLAGIVRKNTNDNKLPLRHDFYIFVLSDLDLWRLVYKFAPMVTFDPCFFPPD